MFSVVIPLYNKEISIRNTIKSVLDQTCQDFEIVVVNDGSTDNSAAVVDAIEDDRIRLIHQKNQGVSAARNRGIEEARFDWVAFLDGDDVWETFHLNEVSLMMRRFPSEKVFVTSFEYSDGRSVYKHPRKEEIFRINDYFLEATYEPLMWTSTVVVHKSCINKVGGFKEGLKRGEDLDLWARLAREYSIIKSSCVTSTYRVEAENRSTQSNSISNSIVSSFSFDDLSTKSEILYFRRLVVGKLRECLLKRNWTDFFKLYHKHYKNISLYMLIKKD